MPPLITGDTVQFRLPLPAGWGESWRPAIVTNPFEGGLANMTVLLDPANDLRASLRLAELLPGHGAELAGDRLHVYSAHEGTEPGCWRRLPRD